MKPLEGESNSADSVDECAALVAEVVPLVMRTIRAEMRSHRGSDLSVVQFRTLGYIRRHPGTSLSDVAEHIGLTLPSISTMISRLEARKLVMRQSAPGDRRRICLELTQLGESVLRSASDATRVRLIQILSDLSPEERSEINQAMHSLQQVFGGGQPRNRSSNNKESEER